MTRAPEWGVTVGIGRREDSSFASPAGRASRDGNEGIRGDGRPPVGSFTHTMHPSMEEKEVYTLPALRRNIRPATSWDGDQFISLDVHNGQLKRSTHPANRRVISAVNIASNHNAKEKISETRRRLRSIRYDRDSSSASQSSYEVLCTEKALGSTIRKHASAPKTLDDLGNLISNAIEEQNMKSNASLTENTADQEALTGINAHGAETTSKTSLLQQHQIPISTAQHSHISKVQQSHTSTLQSSCASKVRLSHASTEEQSHAAPVQRAGAYSTLWQGSRSTEHSQHGGNRSSNSQESSALTVGSVRRGRNNTTESVYPKSSPDTERVTYAGDDRNMVSEQVGPAEEKSRLVPATRLGESGQDSPVRQKAAIFEKLARHDDEIYHEGAPILSHRDGGVTHAHFANTKEPTFEPFQSEHENKSEGSYVPSMQRHHEMFHCKSEPSVALVRETWNSDASSGKAVHIPPIPLALPQLVSPRNQRSHRESESSLHESNYSTALESEASSQASTQPQVPIPDLPLSQQSHERRSQGPWPFKWNLFSHEKLPTAVSIEADAQADTASEQHIHRRTGPRKDARAKIQELVETGSRRDTQVTIPEVTESKSRKRTQSTVPDVLASGLRKDAQSTIQELLKAGSSSTGKKANVRQDKERQAEFKTSSRTSDLSPEVTLQERAKMFMEKAIAQTMQSTSAQGSESGGASIRIVNDEQISQERTQPQKPGKRESIEPQKGMAISKSLFTSTAVKSGTTTQGEEIASDIQTPRKSGTATQSRDVTSETHAYAKTSKSTPAHSATKSGTPMQKSKAEAASPKTPVRGRMKEKQDGAYAFEQRYSLSRSRSCGGVRISVEVRTPIPSPEKVHDDHIVIIKANVEPLEDSCGSP